MRRHPALAALAQREGEREGSQGGLAQWPLSVPGLSLALRRGGEKRDGEGKPYIAK